ncbi:MAG TPA: hypothetical protein VHS81_13370, partial [Caulobacteraceae bacterium]|nr:hypothetical protein [Caulobacteraceae bacterium]
MGHRRARQVHLPHRQVADLHGELQTLLRRLRPLQRLHQLGDVDAHRKDAADPAARVAPRRVLVAHPGLAPVRQHQLHLAKQRLAGQDPLELPRPADRREDLVERAADDVGADQPALLAP